MVKTQSMERGSEAAREILGPLAKMEIRQTRRGWLMELCCNCEAKTEFKVFDGHGSQIGHALEDATFCCRCWCARTRPFVMPVTDLQNPVPREIMTVDRPFVCCAAGSCKCCCYQKASFSSGGQTIGSVKEACTYCVPQANVYDANGNLIYKVHPPTCCGGCCVNCCTEGNTCMGICCKIPFRIYPANQEDTGGDAPFLGKILKKPKSLMVEAFTDAQAFELTFPENATLEEKINILGTSIYLNANYFEGDTEATN